MTRAFTYVLVLTVCAAPTSARVTPQAQSPTTATQAAAPAPGTGQQPGRAGHERVLPLGPDSLAREGVPKGELRGPFVLPSQAYPGTQHTYWVHVPAQYDPAVQASLMIFQDGQAFKDMAGSAPGAERARQPDLPARDAGDDHRLHQSRPHA